MDTRRAEYKEIARQIYEHPRASHFLGIVDDQPKVLNELYGYYPDNLKTVDEFTAIEIELRQAAFEDRISCHDYASMVKDLGWHANNQVLYEKTHGLCTPGMKDLADDLEFLADMLNEEFYRKNDIKFSPRRKRSNEYTVRETS